MDDDDLQQRDENMIPRSMDVPALIELAKLLAVSLIVFDKQTGEVGGRVDMLHERLAALDAGDLEAFEPMTQTLKEFARRQRVAASAADRLVKTIERR